MPQRGPNAPEGLPKRKDRQAGHPAASPLPLRAQGIGLPTRRPHGGFRFTGSFTFLDGTSVR